MLQDDKFYERSKDFLVVEELKGEWTTAADYAERHKEAYKGKIFYTTEDQKQSHILDLYEQKGIEILMAASVVDAPIITLLEDKMDGIKFQRIDGAIDESILDPAEKKHCWMPDGKTESFKIAEFIRTKLKTDTLSVEAKAFKATPSLPFSSSMKTSAGMRETMALSQQQLPPSISAKRTFLVIPTTAHPIDF